MVSNFDRILAEIRREADLIAPNHELQPETVVNLVMSIVDIEDQNRIKPVARINQQVKGMIEEVTLPESPGSK